jgi:hypothetical protein
MWTPTLYSLWHDIIESNPSIHQSFPPPCDPSRFWGHLTTQSKWVMILTYLISVWFSVHTSFHQMPSYICDMPSFLEKWQKPPFNPAKSYCYPGGSLLFPLLSISNFNPSPKKKEKERKFLPNFLKANDYSYFFYFSFILFLDRVGVSTNGFRKYLNLSMNK